MAKTSMFLTAAAIKKQKPAKVRQEIRDTGTQSLYLIIQPTGHKSFATRFRNLHGASAKLTLGPVDLGTEPKEVPTLDALGTPLTLGAARTLVAEVHRQRARGRDVLADHKALKRRRKITITEGIANSFATGVRRFIDEHASRKTRSWRTAARHLGLYYPKHGGEPEIIPGGLAQQWADRSLKQIDASLIWTTVDEARESGVPGLKRNAKGRPTDIQARMLLASLSSMFRWAKDRRMVELNPCSGVSRPPASVPRDRVLDAGEIVKFWHAADAEHIVVAVALKLMLLTGSRLDEVSRMRWSEVSEDGLTWTIPGGLPGRTKNKRVHKVPLAPLVRDLLATLPRISGCDFVFTYTGRVPLNGWSRAKLHLDETMKIPAWRLHDLRRTYVTHLAELGIRDDVIELSINHVSGARRGVAGVYNRSELLPERRAALERWAAHLDGLMTRRSATVTVLHAN